MPLHPRDLANLQKLSDAAEKYSPDQEREHGRFSGPGGGGGSDRVPQEDELRRGHGASLQGLARTT